MRREVKAAQLQALRHGKGTRVSVGDDEIVLFRIGDEVHAVRNLCPHQHFALLHEGVLEGTTLTCPMHGWSFDCTTGLPVKGGGRLAMFRTSVRNGEVFLIYEDADL